MAEAVLCTSRPDSRGSRPDSRGRAASSGTPQPYTRAELDAPLDEHGDHEAEPVWSAGLYHSKDGFLAGDVGASDIRELGFEPDTSRYRSNLHRPAAPPRDRRKKSTDGSSARGDGKGSRTACADATGEGADAEGGAGGADGATAHARARHGASEPPSPPPPPKPPMVPLWQARAQRPADGEAWARQLLMAMQGLLPSSIPGENGYRSGRRADAAP